jgi:hypothetical protein
MSEQEMKLDGPDFAQGVPLADGHVGKDDPEMGCSVGVVVADRRYVRCDRLPRCPSAYPADVPITWGIAESR